MFSTLWRDISMRFTPRPTVVLHPIDNVRCDVMTLQDPLSSVRNDEAFHALTPTRIRHFRIESEAQVFVHIYRHAAAAKRFVQLYGHTRSEFGSVVPLWDVDPTSVSDDDLMAQAVFDAKLCLDAVRNPVIAVGSPELADDRSDAATPTAAAPPAAAPGPQSQTVPARPPSPVLVADGIFQYCGLMPWRGPAGQVGKASFAVCLVEGDTERMYWGSDLERVVRDSGVIPGDAIRLTKYPKTKVTVIDVHGKERVVPKNIWTLEWQDILKRAA